MGDNQKHFALCRMESKCKEVVGKRKLESNEK